MNQEYSTNYLEDRIEFIIALMTKDYEKTHDIGDRLLKRNRNDVYVARALNILKHKKHKECGRSNLIESDSKCRGSDVTDGDDIDFIGNDAVISIDPSKMASKIASRDTSRFNNKAKTRLDFKRNMYRVISINANKKV
ncbi:uncharacterized protein LOC105834097 isoform X2 [Monomorium pharaonis]|uniref:uncharacterized protein LOC105834097 isoform X2 n=1 Tax=Monomorium pharaonis TaxID=307658 RepID=UPI00063EFFB2|nr:uncharacterized protein LOC105834097 isoform X2 [Monomorium pharaonis]